MITVSTTAREELIDITNEVNERVRASNVKEGICMLFCMHTSAALIVNENYDPGLKQDLLDKLRELVPEGGHRHDKLDGNADSHIKAAIIGPSLSIPIRNGKLLLGQWQGIMLAEFSGPRTRDISITCM